MLPSFLASPLALLGGILCLTACIFIHELGHFLAARWRGARVPRFSIFGLGKPIWSRTWRGVEWCICWIPFGAYVQIPQLADLGEIEGGEIDGIDVSGPPLGFRDKVIVSAAGPVFNLVLAFALASVLWVVGQEISAEVATTRIGFVSPTITLSDGTKVPSPAAQAGLQFGDTIVSIDGRRATEWQDVLESIVMGSGNIGGERAAHFVVERDGQEVTLTVNPRLATDEKIRRIGISPYCEPIVSSVEPDSTGAQVGLLAGDRIDAIDGAAIRSFATLNESLRQNADRPVLVRVLREGRPIELHLPTGTATAKQGKFGVLFTTDFTIVHIDPFTQVGTFIGKTLTMFWKLVNPYSDVGIRQLSSPIGIVANLTQAVQAGPRVVLWFTVLINVALAVFNLLPIPVLDGGHILFGAIGKLRGRPINPEFVAKIQFTFFVLLISLMFYVATRDVRRLTRDFGPTAEEKTQDQKEPPPTPAAAPAPAQP